MFALDFVVGSALGELEDFLNVQHRHSPLVCVQGVRNVNVVRLSLELLILGAIMDVDSVPIGQNVVQVKEEGKSFQLLEFQVQVSSVEVEGSFTGPNGQVVGLGNASFDFEDLPSDGGVESLADVSFSFEVFKQFQVGKQVHERILF